MQCLVMICAGRYKQHDFLIARGLFAKRVGVRSMGEGGGCLCVDYVKGRRIEYSAFG